jgi:hypothetical protein
MITRRSFLAAASASGFEPGRFLGVTLMPEYIQSEGIDGVLGKLQHMRATAVCTSPYVMEPASAQTGSREPPDDAGAGGVRLRPASFPISASTRVCATSPSPPANSPAAAAPWSESLSKQPSRLA